MGFDWHTEEKSSWEEKPQPRRRPVRLRRQWLLPLLSFVLIGALLFWWLHRQSKAAMAAVRAEVLGSHTLVLDTAVRHDKELFAEQLDGQETTGWQDMQEALFDQVDLLDRWPFGLTLPASHAAPSAAAPSVTFTPDLEMATVTFSRTYSVTAPELSQKEETVRLRHTFHYRLQGDDRHWVLTEPPADFWGEERTFTGNWLTLTYPARDEALARRLGEAIDEELDVLCAQLLTDSCHSDLNLTVHLETKTTAWKALFRRNWRGIIPRQLTLPTPTLVGRPLDETGYRALYRGYATYVLLQAVAQLKAEGAAVSVHNFLIQRGLRPWPLLATNQNSAADAPLPLPRALHMFCQGVGAAGTVGRFDPTTAVPSRQLPNRTFLAARPTDEAGLLLLEQKMVDDRSHIQLLRRQGDEEHLLFAQPWSPDEGKWVLGPTSPAERYIVLTYHAADEDSYRYGRIRLVDLAACDGKGCRSRQIAGHPVWSPDGQHALVQEYAEDGDLILRGDGDLRATVPIGQGWNPVWLDEETHSYTTGMGKVLIGDVDSTQPETVIEADQVGAEFPQEDASVHTWLLANPSGRDYMYASQIVDSAGDGWPMPGSKGVLYPLAEPDDTLMSPAISIPGEHYHYPQLSPDGRWLYFLEGSPDGDGWRLQFYASPPPEGKLVLHYERLYPDPLPFLAPSFQHLAVPPWPRVTWSADDEWALVSYDGVVDLIAPRQRYHRLVAPDGPGCVFDWIE